MVRRAMCKKKAKDDGQGAGGLYPRRPGAEALQGCVANGIDPRRRPRKSTTRSTTLPTTPSTRPTPFPMRWWPIRRRISSATLPREYMAALLTSVLDNSDKVSGYIGECRECGIAPAAAGHQPFRRPVHGGGGGHPVRPGGHQEHRPGLHSGSDAGAGDRRATLHPCTIFAAA